jgi:hypothetical protein
MAASQPSAVALGENPRTSAKKQTATPVHAKRRRFSDRGSGHHEDAGKHVVDVAAADGAAESGAKRVTEDTIEQKQEEHRHE